MHQGIAILRNRQSYALRGCWTHGHTKESLKTETAVVVTHRISSLDPSGATPMRSQELTWKNSLSVALLMLLSVPLVVSCGPSHGAGKAEPPKPPREVKLRVVPEGLEVSWEKVSEAKHYTVFWGMEDGKYDRLYNVSGNHLLITSLRKGELYVVAVTSWNQDRESDYSRGALIVYDDDADRAAAHLAKGKELLARGALDPADAYLSASIRLIEAMRGSARR